MQSLPQVPAETFFVNRVDVIVKNIASMKETLEQLVSLLEHNRSQFVFILYVYLSSQSTLLSPTPTLLFLTRRNHLSQLQNTPR